MVTIEVRYTCGLCPASDVPVKVVARTSDEDLGEWMEKLTLVVQADHMRRSPGCRARKLKQLAIPIENAEWVGGPPLQ